VREFEARAAARWRGLGRILPREVRERIYEPAFSDLLYRWLTQSAPQRLPFGMYALATVLGCARIAVPRMFIRNGAPTRLTRVFVVLLLAVAVAVVILQRITRTVYSY